MDSDIRRVRSRPASQRGHRRSHVSANTTAGIGDPGPTIDPTDTWSRSTVPASGATTTHSFTAFSVSVSSAWAQGNGNGHAKAAGPSMQTADTGQVTLSATITAIERQTIFAYFQQHQASYAGMKPLPPGIAKKIARGGTLPPGIAKRYFPNDLIAQLPPRPGQQWVIVGTDVLLIQAGTSLILDLLARVL